ncbi:MAG: glycosyl hydrolase family 2 [Promethearchaeota archaeon]
MNIKLSLNENWLMQSSEKISKYGETISSTDFNPEDWYPVDIPTTVVNGLVKNGVFDDPYHGVNMKAIPGYKQDVYQNYDNYYKPDDSPFRRSWWFRKEFDLDENLGKREFWLFFKGISYSANIWLNGKRIAGSNHVIGIYRRYDFNVTRFIKPGTKNVLAIEVFSQNPDDLGISFVDWCPLPPDDNMGIWQPVFLYMTGPIAMKHVFVQSKLNIETKEAKLMISTEIHNTRKEKVKGIIEGRIEDIAFKKEVILNNYEEKVVTFSIEEFPQLRISNPRIWWPYQLGSPELYTLDIKVRVKGEISDSDEITFGIRDIKSYINEHGSRVFTVNGQDILIRGTGWTSDMMLHQSEEQDEIDIAFLKNLNMNTIRFEGKLATDHFWDLCDKEGILVLAGWVCCSHWEKWDNWKEGDLDVAEASLRSQILRLRNHPSFAAWLYGSDFPPPTSVERIYLKVLEETYEELPNISSASAAPSDLKGETGVKMTGPYTYVPPVYWYTAGRIGAADGFNTETGPDVCIPPIGSLKRMFPEDQLQVGSEHWNYHAALGAFKSTEVVEEAIEKRYGKPETIEDFAKTAQVLGYECWRAMYEAHARNFPKATGVIGWMHNSPWPSLIWQLYDYYNNPNGAFFGSKKACEPLHVQYSYDDSTIWVVNSTLDEKENLLVTAKVFNLNSEEKLSQTVEKTTIKPNDRLKVLTIPEIDGLSPVYFIHLTLQERSTVVSRNFYWLSIKEDVFQEKDDWPYTPLKSHADMSAIRTLPEAEVEKSFNIRENSKNYEITVELKNTSSNIAFFLRIIVIDKKTRQFIAPVHWDDNCVSLFPSEKVEIKGVFPKKAIIGKPIFVVEGWNC